MSSVQRAAKRRICAAAADVLRAVPGPWWDTSRGERAMKELIEELDHRAEPPAVKTDDDWYYLVSPADFDLERAQQRGRDEMNPLKRVCPTCGAGADERCKQKSGRPVQRFHWHTARLPEEWDR